VTSKLQTKHVLFCCFLRPLKAKTQKHTFTRKEISIQAPSPPTFPRTLYSHHDQHHESQLSKAEINRLAVFGPPIYATREATSIMEEEALCLARITLRDPLEPFEGASLAARASEDFTRSSSILPSEQSHWTCAAAMQFRFESSNPQNLSRTVQRRY
jgi:hypothetical protein